VLGSSLFSTAKFAFPVSFGFSFHCTSELWKQKVVEMLSMVMSRNQNAGQNQIVRINNSTFERVEEFKYLGTTSTNQNPIPEEIKSRLKLRNSSYHSVQNLLSSRLLSKSLKIKIYRTLILPVVLYGCETCSLTLREERKLRLFENMMLRRIFGPRRDDVTGE